MVLLEFSSALGHFIGRHLDLSASVSWLHNTTDFVVIAVFCDAFAALLRHIAPPGTIPGP